VRPDFFDVEYLLKGSAIQQAGYRAIVSSAILHLLRDFDPVVVGTMPLDLFVGTSDIDIICHFSEAEKFQSVFHHTVRKELNGVDSVIASFEFDSFEFEIVGQPIPVRDQFAYRHMIAEWDILQVKGEVFRNKILALKKSGLKTEPAFAQLLGLQGNPYEALLNYTF
jgi:hypothetical protein